VANERLAKKGDMVVIDWRGYQLADFITITKVVEDRYYYIDCQNFIEGDFPESSLIAWMKQGMAKIIKCDKVKRDDPTRD
jgi:hypothetical protein